MLCACTNCKYYTEVFGRHKWYFAHFPDHSGSHGSILDIVVHIMQPNIRAYYKLEEIWGGKPVRVKLGAPGGVGRAAA
jgi:hypothetical protein